MSRPPGGNWPPPQSEQVQAQPPASTEARVPLRRRWWFRAGCALVPFIAIVLVVSTANESSPRPSATSTTVPRPVPHTSPPSTAPGAAVGDTSAAAPEGSAAASGAGGTSAGGAGGTSGAAAGTSGTNPGNLANVSAWTTAHSQLLGVLRADVTNVDADATNQEFAALPGDCARLQGDLQTAQSTPPVPNSAGSALWSQALGDFVQAVTQCSNGVADHDVSQISEAAQAASSGEIVLAGLVGQSNGQSSS